MQGSESGKLMLSHTCLSRALCSKRARPQWFCARRLVTVIPLAALRVLISRALLRMVRWQSSSLVSRCLITLTEDDVAVFSSAPSSICAGWVVAINITSGHWKVESSPTVTDPNEKVRAPDMTQLQQLVGNPT